MPSGSSIPALGPDVTTMRPAVAVVAWVVLFERGEGFAAGVGGSGPVASTLPAAAGSGIFRTRTPKRSARSE